MADPIVTASNTITFLPSAGMAVVTTAPAVVLVTSGPEVTATFLPAMTESDLSNITAWPATYIKGPYVGGVGTISVDDWGSYSSTLTKNGEPVATNPPGTTGSYTLSVLVPAILPGAPPTLDAVTSYSGTFTITTPQTVLKA